MIKDFFRFFKIPYAKYLIIGLLLYGVGVGILAPMNAVYLDLEVGLNKLEIMTVFSVSVILNIIITLFVGYVSDRLLFRKRIPLLALIICMIGILYYMQATTFWTALIGMIVAVAPSGLIMGQLFAMARNHFIKFVPDIFEIAQVWLRAMFSIGFFMGLLLGANLYVVTGFKGILYGNFFSFFILFFLLLLYQEQEPIMHKGDKSYARPFSIVMLLVLLLLACADAVRGLYLPLVVVDLFERPELMAYLWSVQAVFELGFMTIAGYLAMRFGPEKVIMLAAFCALLTYGVYASAPPLYVFFLMQPIYSFFVSVLYAVGIGFVQAMFAEKVGFGSSVFVILLEMAKLVGYILPFIVQGYDPYIFMIALTFSAVSIGLIVLYLYRQRRLGLV